MQIHSRDAVRYACRLFECTKGEKNQINNKIKGRHGRRSFWLTLPNFGRAARFNEPFATFFFFTWKAGFKKELLCRRSLSQCRNLKILFSKVNRKVETLRHEKKKFKFLSRIKRADGWLDERDWALLCDVLCGSGAGAGDRPTVTDLQRATECVRIDWRSVSRVFLAQLEQLDVAPSRCREKKNIKKKTTGKQKSHCRFCYFS